MTGTEQERLVLEHLAMVRRLARVYAKRLPPSADRGELESVGTLGLMEAARRFDPGAGVLFRTFADFRVRGAIVDHMRERARYRRDEHERREAGEDVGPRVVFDSTVADAIARTRTVLPAPIEDIARTPRLRAALTLLPRREGFLIVWRFWHGMTLAVCADRLGVKESRASQLQTMALARLRAILDAASYGPRTVEDFAAAPHPVADNPTDGSQVHGG